MLKIKSENGVYTASESKGKILFGGEHNYGDVDGLNAADVINAALDYLKVCDQLDVPFSITIKNVNDYYKEWK